MIGPELEQLIQKLGRLPGLGPRSARRMALALLNQRDKLMIPLGRGDFGSGPENKHLCRMWQS